MDDRVTNNGHSPRRRMPEQAGAPGPRARWHLPVRLEGYRREWFTADLLAGITVAAVLIPSALAYGALAGLTPVAGLYAGVAAMLGYAIFGRSRRLILGPEAASAILVAAGIAPLAGGDAVRYAALAAALAVMVGVITMLGALARLGFLADFLSRPVLAGYMTGVALTIIVGQFGKLLGISIEADAFLGQLVELVEGIEQAQLLTCGVALACIAVLVIGGIVRPRFPTSLLVIALATVVSALASLEDHDVAVVGAIPRGLPMPGIPDVGWSDLGDLAPSSLSLAVFAFVTSILTAKSFSARPSRVDADAEMRGVAMANLAAGFFSGFPVAASDSRTVVNVTMGARSRFAGVFAAGIVVLFLLFFTSLLSPLPVATLGAIVSVAAVKLIDLHTVEEFYRLRPVEAGLAVVTCVGVLLLGILPGIVLAVALSLVVVIARISRPHDAILGRVAGIDGFRDIAEESSAETVPGLITYRFDGPLFFANADYFLHRIRYAMGRSEHRVRWLLLDAEAIPDVDVTGLEALHTLASELDEAGTRLAIARARAPLRKALHLAGLVSTVGEAYLFRTVATGVEAFLQEDGLRDEPEDARASGTPPTRTRA